MLDARRIRRLKHPNQNLRLQMSQILSRKPWLRPLPLRIIVNLQATEAANHLPLWNNHLAKLLGRETTSTKKLRTILIGIAVMPAPIPATS